MKILRFTLLTLFAFLLLAGCSTSDPNELTLFIGPEIIGCQGEGVRHCMEVQYEADGETDLFPNPIIGLDYEQGYNYEIRVRRTPIEDEMFEFEFELIEVISKEAAY